MGSKSSGDKPKPTEQEKALADVAYKKYEIYDKYYRPLAKEQLKNSKSTGAKRAAARSLVNADMRIARKGAIGKQAAGGLSRGLQLGDARVQSEQAAGHRAAQTVTAHAKANAVEGTHDAERAGQLRHIKLGHGLASQSQASMTQQANNATSSAIASAQAQMAESDAYSTGLGQFFGGVAATQGGVETLGKGMGDWFGGGGRPSFDTGQLNAGGRSMRDMAP